MAPTTKHRTYIFRFPCSTTAVQHALEVVTCKILHLRQIKESDGTWTFIGYIIFDSPRHNIALCRLFPTGYFTPAYLTRLEYAPESIEGELVMHRGLFPKTTFDRQLAGIKRYRARLDNEDLVLKLLADVPDI